MNRLFINLIKNNLSKRNFSVSKKIIKNNRLGSQVTKQDNLFSLKKNKIKKEYENRKDINIYKNNSQVEKQDNLYIL